MRSSVALNIPRQKVEQQTTGGFARHETAPTTAACTPLEGTPSRTGSLRLHATLVQRCADGCAIRNLHHLQ